MQRHREGFKYHKDGLQVDDVPIPTHGPKDGLIKVHATSITADELTWPETTKREVPIPGQNVAGTKVSVGSEVKGSLAEGDNVFASTSFSRDGGAAEYMVASYLEIARRSSQWVAPNLRHHEESRVYRQHAYQHPGVPFSQKHKVV